MRIKSAFVWSQSCQRAFETIKSQLVSAPIIISYTKPFAFTVDASDVDAGAMLTKDSKVIDHPIGHFSHKFNTSQRNYSTIEMEAVALIFALTYMLIYMDQNPLVILHIVRKMKTSVSVNGVWLYNLMT